MDRDTVPTVAKRLGVRTVNLQVEEELGSFEPDGVCRPRHVERENARPGRC